MRPFPPSRGGVWKVSNNDEGRFAIWSQSGHELFYETADRIMVVDYTVDGDAFVPGTPRVWSQRPLFYAGISNLDLAPVGGGGRWGHFGGAKVGQAADVRWRWVVPDRHTQGTQLARKRIVILPRKLRQPSCRRLGRLVEIFLDSNEHFEDDETFPGAART